MPPIPVRLRALWARLPFPVDPLIAEAKRRARQRRFSILVAILVVAGVGVTFGFMSPPGAPGSSGPPGAGLGAATRLSAQGIGGVHIGTSKAQAVAALSRTLGAPSRRFVSDACGPRYTEVAWGHLYAEFRQSSFTGFRYMSGVWLPSGVYPGRHSLAPLQPPLSTTGGITIGDTLGQLRDEYGKLGYVGTDRWQDGAGLVFYDNAQHDPEAASSRIIEIEYGTCGDF